MAQFMPTVYSVWKLLEAVVFAYLYLLHVHQHLHSKCRQLSSGWAEQN